MILDEYLIYLNESIQLNLIDVKLFGFLVDLDQVKQYSKDHRILLNRGSIVALKKAERDLPEGHKFLIKYGYRSYEEQEKIVKDTEKELKKSHPNNWEELLNTYTGGYKDLNEKNISYMNHRSGNAVDLTIVFNGKELDLGNVKLDKRDSLDYYEKNNQNTIIRDNRRLLKSVMTKHSFVPYPLEWWHWGFSK